MARFAFTMTKDNALSRPAMSAIAAFLALSTPAAFAQEAPTIPMSPPVAVPPPQTAPTTTPGSPDGATTAPRVAPATQPAEPAPIIRVPLDIAPPETAPAEAEAAPPPARREAPARAERNARPAAAPTRAEPAPAAAPAETATTEAAEMAAPAAPPVLVDIAPVAEPAPAAVETTTDEPFPWELAGGAALLLALAGAGLVLARSRRAAAPVEYAEVEYADTALVSEAAAQASDQPWVTPAYTAQPATARSTPSFAAAPSGSMGRHEAMAMAGPTPDNPFATLSKRLKRARFLDRQERLAYEQTLGTHKDMTRKPVSAWEIAQRDIPATTQEQEVRRPEPARGRRDLRPGFSRS